MGAARCACTTCRAAGGPAHSPPQPVAAGVRPLILACPRMPSGRLRYGLHRRYGTRGRGAGHRRAPTARSRRPHMPRMAPSRRAPVSAVLSAAVECAAGNLPAAIRVRDTLKLRSGAIECTRRVYVSKYGGAVGFPLDLWCPGALVGTSPPQNTTPAGQTKHTKPSVSVSTGGH